MVGRGWLCLVAGLVGCATAQPVPDPQVQEELQDCRELNADFGELHHYRDQNAQVAASRPQVVFYGDSITEFWKLDRSFPGKPYVNRGISGQTTSQLLARFRQDVLEVAPTAVVILGGINDFKGELRPSTLPQLEANLASMVQLAQANHIGVVLASVMPVHLLDSTPPDTAQQPPHPQVVELNQWIRAYCEAHGVVYLDYFSSMVDAQGLMTQGLADDGLHPNDAGYARMAPLAEQAIGRLQTAHP